MKPRQPAPSQFLVHTNDFWMNKGGFVDLSSTPRGSAATLMDYEPGLQSFTIAHCRPTGLGSSLCCGVWVVDFFPPNNQQWGANQRVMAGAVSPSLSWNDSSDFGLFGSDLTWGVEILRGRSGLSDDTPSPPAWNVTDGGALRVAVVAVPAQSRVTVMVRKRGQPTEQQAAQRLASQLAAHKEAPLEVPEAMRGASAEERGRAAEEWKTKGNAAFVADKFKEAAEHYTAGLALDSSNSRLWCNRAYMRFKMGEYVAAVKDASHALSLDPNYAKALLRRAQARAALGVYTAAVSDLERALQLDVNDKTVRAELDRVRQAMRPEQGVNMRAPYNPVHGGVQLAVDLGNAVGARAELVGLATVTDPKAITWERLDELFPLR